MKTLFVVLIVVLFMANVAHTPGLSPENPIERAALRVKANANSTHEIMAFVIYGEAGGESYQEKLRVGHTLKNRYNSKDGKISYEQIVYLFYWPIRSLRKLTWSEFQAWKDSFVAAQEVLGSRHDITKGATHFYFPKERNDRPYWGERQKELKLGSTFVFYRNIAW